MGYPKTLYRDGLAASVNDAPEEAAYVEAGWKSEEWTPVEPPFSAVPVVDDVSSEYENAPVLDEPKVKKGAKKK